VYVCCFVLFLLSKFFSMNKVDYLFSLNLVYYVANVIRVRLLLLLSYDVFHDTGMKRAI